MKIVLRIVLGLAAVGVVAVAGAVAYLVVAPPELLRVATGYAAKTVCSNVFIAGRDPDQVLAVDVQAPGHPVLKFVRQSVDMSAGTVTARMLGLFATSIAIHRNGLGCASVPDGNVAAAQAVQLAQAPQIAPPGDAVWPMGGHVEMVATPTLADIMGNAALTGPGMRAVVVVKGGEIIAEAYGEGFTADTPLLGWSMSKTVNAALIGRLSAAGLIGLDDAALRPEWTDARRDITLRDLLGMESGLAFNEDYGDVSDVNRMLFLEPDMARFAAAQPQAEAAGAQFTYSSGTATLLARIWMDRIGDRATALAYPRGALFDPLGMTSAELEADASGTLVGSSYMYATARDWARFGLFLLQDGVWDGTRLLPPGWVAAMNASNGLPGNYSQMQSWLQGPNDEDAAEGVPEDAFWLIGHDGQTVAIVPSEELVVVRLGLTPSDLGYRPERLVKALADAT
ncbi:MAG: serine hydrolase [Devosia sp.]|uniref:serine hydrolase domain-containing protein n=1 Tax=Devosia sp. TaxID=1871048 RepID=UPI001A364932|nr:serine hydrolase [Devosia sp.]MBL8596660.1 serine hydrolase [Devosia sp.]